VAVRGTAEDEDIMLFEFQNPTLEGTGPDFQSNGHSKDPLK
jgi:hypothetical protein